MTTTLHIRRLLLGAATALTLLATGCGKDDPATPAPAPKTIVDVAVGNPDFSALVAAVTKTGLASTLAGPGAFTVFAPTNAAFAQLGLPYNTAANINGITATADIDFLRGVLLYHALPGAGRKAADFPNGPSIQMTARPSTGIIDNLLYLSKGSAGVFINGNSKVVTADVPAANGVIHAIDRVLLPPTRTVAGLVTASAQAATGKEFTILLQALSLNPGLVAAASNSGANLTVFAPTDAAFRAAGITDASTVAPAFLLRVLQLHIITSGRVFSPDLAATQTVATANAEQITIAASATGVTVRGAGNGTNAANVTAANVLATNGVVHVIDRVLLP